MLPAPDDDLVFHRLSRANVEVRVPLRLLPARVCLLSAAEAKAALPAEDAPERIFVVRYPRSNPNPNPNRPSASSSCATRALTLTLTLTSSTSPRRRWFGPSP